ncbi:bifunctional folylpolyglutamate synthase/dihydrofolate synthase [bacterium]|nr:bifunctional folylpolyglutamate synthase/dihydrofolate synthase [bacterium]
MSEPTRGPLPAPNTHPAEFDAGFTLHDGYASALLHLYGRLNTEALDPINFARVDRSLESYRAFLAELDDPHLAKPTVHITGTRGKGSTLSMLEAILLQAGVSTGATVSPHLVEVRERIRIDGIDLTRDRFTEMYERIRPVADKRMSQANYRTVFELLTALAFVTFQQSDIDVALVEVGMGGRLDATNVVSPLLSIITRIGLDHTHILGDTVEKIADDKGQIIKSGGPAIISHQPDGALRVLEDRCREVGVECWRLGHEIQIENVSVTTDGTEFTVHTPSRSHTGMRTPLLGRHQAENAAVAVAAADRLLVDGHFSLSEDAVRTGLSKTRWPGRGEILDHDPILMIDGAHTDQGATALSNLLDDVFPERPRILILGMNRDKHPKEFLDCFATSPRLVLATRAESPRSMEADELAEIVRERGFECQTVDLHNALNMARELANPDDLIVATGSFYVIGALRRLRLRENEEDSTLQRSR